MPEYPGFIGATYTSRGIAVAAEVCRNLFPEKIRGDGGRGHGDPGYVLYRTPGTRLFAQAPDGSRLRGFYREPSQETTFAVCGRNLYRLDSTDGTYLSPTGILTLIGPVGAETPANTALGRLSFASNGSQIAICSEAQLFIYDMGARTLVPVEDAPFARTNGGGGAGTVSFLDDSFIVSEYGTRKLYYSDLLDGTTGHWPALNVGSKEGASDPIIAIVADHKQLLIFGSLSMEPWYDSGDSTNPYQPIPGTFIEQGLVASRCYAIADNTVFFLSQDRMGAGIIYRMDGYTPMRVSNHAVEWAIQQYPRLDDAVAYAYQDSGHTFIVFSFPSGGAILEPLGGDIKVLPGGWTWVYDCATGMWHERTHFKDGMETMHYGVHHVFALDKHLVGGGDDTGNIYWMDRQYLHDNGDLIRCMRSAPVLNADKKYLYMGAFELDAQVGILPDPRCGACQDADNPLTITMTDAGGVVTTFDTNIRTVCMVVPCTDQEYAFTAKVTDSLGATATADCTIQVLCTAPIGGVS